MPLHNKIVVASEMLLEADRRFGAADREMDYVVSILLSGAVIGVVGPLIKEQGGRTMHQLLAKIGELVAEPGDDPAHEGMYRVVYNSLKHSGNERTNLKPSEDLEIHTDLRTEAAHMLDEAVEDFRKVEVPREIRISLTPRFVEFLAGYAGHA